MAGDGAGGGKFCVCHYGGDVWYVKSIFMIHVGGTRCVTSSTDHNMNIQARITLNVEFIRGYIFYFYLMCEYNDEYDQD